MLRKSCDDGSRRNKNRGNCIGNYCCRFVKRVGILDICVVLVVVVLVVVVVVVVSIVAW